MSRKKSEQTCSASVSRRYRQFRRYRPLYWMLIPAILYYVIFQYGPMFGAVIAFQDYSPYKGILGSEWVGLQNFKDFFEYPDAWKLVRNTAILSLCSLVFTFPMPIVLALAFQEIRQKRFSKITQTVTLLPHFISMVIMVGLMVNFISPTTGIINRIIQTVFCCDPINFLAGPKYFRLIYVLLYICKETGWGAVIYVASLSGVPVELYEAAEIDGAGRWRKIWSVSLPSILPSVIVMLIMKLGNILEIGANTIILFYNPMMYDTADILSTFVYRRGLLGTDYSFGTAVGLMNSIVALALVWLTNKISKKVTETSLW